MPNPILPALMLLLAIPVTADAEMGVEQRVATGQLTIRQRIIIRVPRLPVGRMPIAPDPAEAPRMVEKKGPKCVPIEDLAGSAVARKDSVDLMLDDGTQLRAKLDDDCPALDFYVGFYIKPNPDGQICADRDVIRARSGGACPISSFKRLVVKR